MDAFKLLESYFTPSIGVWFNEKHENSNFYINKMNSLCQKDSKRRNLRLMFYDITTSMSSDFYPEKIINSDFDLIKDNHESLYGLYDSFKIEFLKSMKPMKHDYTRHLFGCVFILHFNGLETIDNAHKMNILLNQSLSNGVPLNSNPMSSFFSTSLIRHYIIINNPLSATDKELHDSVHLKLKSSYGDSVYYVNDFNNDEIIEDFIIDFSNNYLMPYMEHLLKNLYTLVSSKKDRTKSILSSAKKWFNTSSNIQSNSSYSNLNSIPDTSSLPTPLRNEHYVVIVRKYADLCILLGNYNVAYDTYSYYRKLINEKTDYLLLAGALEMKAISKFLLDGEIIFKHLETSITTYQIGYKNNECALRAAIFAVELFTFTKNYSKAANEALKIINKYNDSITALFYERISLIYGMNKMFRKQAFYGFLAAFSYFQSGKEYPAFKQIKNVLSLTNDIQMWVSKTQCRILYSRLCNSLKIASKEYNSIGPLIKKNNISNIIKNYEIALFNNVILLNSHQSTNDFFQENISGISIQSQYIKIFINSLTNCTEKYCHFNLVDKCRLGTGCLICSSLYLRTKRDVLIISFRQMKNFSFNNSLIRSSFIDFKSIKTAEYLNKIDFFFFVKEKFRIVIPVCNLWLFDITIINLRLKWILFDQNNSLISDSTDFDSKNYVGNSSIESVRLAKSSQNMIVFVIEVYKQGVFIIKGLEFSQIRIEYENIIETSSGDHFQVGSLFKISHSETSIDPSLNNQPDQLFHNSQSKYFLPLNFTSLNEKFSDKKFRSVFDNLTDASKNIFSQSSDENFQLKIKDSSASFKMMLHRNKSTYYSNEIVNFKLQIHLQTDYNWASIDQKHILLATDYNYVFFSNDLEKPIKCDSCYFYPIDINRFDKSNQLEFNASIRMPNHSFKLCFGLFYSWMDSHKNLITDLLYDEIDFNIEPYLNMVIYEKSNLENSLLLKNTLLSIEISSNILPSISNYYTKCEIIELFCLSSISGQSFFTFKENIIDSNSTLSLPFLLQLDTIHSNEVKFSQFNSNFQSNELLVKSCQHFLNQFKMELDSTDQTIFGALWSQNSCQLLSEENFETNKNVFKSKQEIDDKNNPIKTGLLIGSIAAPIHQLKSETYKENSLIVHTDYTFYRPMHFVFVHPTQIVHDFTKGLCCLDIIVKLQSFSDVDITGVVEAIQPYRIKKYNGLINSYGLTEDGLCLADARNYMWLGLITQSINIQKISLLHYKNPTNIVEDMTFRCCFTEEGMYNVGLFKATINLNGRFAVLQSNSPSYVNIIALRSLL